MKQSEGTAAQSAHFIFINSIVNHQRKLNNGFDYVSCLF